MAATQARTAWRWRVLAVVAASLLVVALVGLVVVRARSLGPPPRIGAGSGRLAAPAGPYVAARPRAIYDVVDFGADPTGQRDATAAIARAISAAEREPGSEVYFPPGRYLLDQRSSRLFTFVIDRRIELVGAGIDRTELINEVGAKTPGVKLSRDMFAIEVAPGTQVGGGSGSVIADMTLDSASYDAGTDVMDFANHTTLANLRVDAASSSNRYNPNSFGIRVIAVCSPRTINSVFRVGNLVEHVTIVGNGADGMTELDLSCQVGTVVSDVHIAGNGMDIFYCHHDLVSGATLVGGTDGDTKRYTWVITGSSDIRLERVTTVGNGGVIAPDVRLVSRGITISGEVMRNPADALYIGDATAVTIANSQLGVIAMLPRRAISGVLLEETRYRSVRCKRGVAITHLVGLACP